MNFVRFFLLRGLVTWSIANTLDAEQMLTRRAAVAVIRLFPRRSSYPFPLRRQLSKRDAARRRRVLKHRMCHRVCVTLRGSEDGLYFGCPDALGRSRVTYMSATSPKGSTLAPQARAPSTGHCGDCHHRCDTSHQAMRVGGWPRETPKIEPQPAGQTERRAPAAPRLRRACSRRVRCAR